MQKSWERFLSARTKVRLVKKVRNQKETQPTVDFSAFTKQTKDPGESTKSPSPSTLTANSATYAASTSNAIEEGANTSFVKQTGYVLIKSIPEGDIVMRADGKKVLRRKKNAVIGKESNRLVYRRADGKLVRRVEKNSKLTSTAGDLAGLLDGRKPTQADRTDDMATVAGSLPVEASMKCRETTSTPSLPTKNDNCASKEERPTSPGFTLDIEYESNENTFEGRETRMMTLAEIAKASGRDPQDLKRAVAQHNGSPKTRPRFILNPVCPKQADNDNNMVEVVVPVSVSRREKSPLPEGQCSPLVITKERSDR